MNQKLDKFLCDKYPKIFADRNKSPQETCMCWGFPGDGWFFLLDSACSLIQFHVDQPRWIPRRGNTIKQWYNLTVWNYIVYPIAKFLAFGEISFLQRKIQSGPFKGASISTKQPSKRQWAVYNWFVKWFQFDIRYKQSDVPNSQVVADQVKEKFETLRFYVHGGDDYTRGIVDFAESLSAYICEDCGRFDESVATNSRGWIRTTCDKCTPKEHKKDHEKNQKARTRNVVWNKSRQEAAKKRTRKSL